jgi:WD40 repeat protein
MSAIETEFRSDFYTAGGTLPHDAPSYVARKADQELFDGLRQGQFCYVLTSRQMGKSSLMTRTVRRLRETGAGVAVLDLTAIGQNLSAEQWYGGLLIQMGQRLDLEDELIQFWQSKPLLGPLQRWMKAIRQVVLPRYPDYVVIFVDEIDAVRNLPFSTDEFFAAIRECYNDRVADPELERLTFCLLGVASPSDLIRDTRTTPFNIGRRIELHDFTRPEAAPLESGLAGDRWIKETLLTRVLHWTNGHPYLTQRFCHAIVEENGRRIEAVDRICVELFFSQHSRERDDNLLFVRERILRSEADPVSLLTLYARVWDGKRVIDDEANPLISILRLSGIARVEDGRLRVRNRIYRRVFNRRWITENMPDAELRRQRAAYRRGLFRAAAVAAVILAFIVVLALGFLKQRNRAIQQEQTNRRQLYAAQMNLAQQAWETGNYGRTRELVEAWQPKHGEEDLRGFEWYYLWKLYHQNVLFTLRHNDEVRDLAFSPDGKSIATASADNTAKLWDVETGRELITFNGHKARLQDLDFSPDGKRLATASSDNTARIWDAASGLEIASLKGHQDEVWSVDFSRDGKSLATGSLDGTARLWEVANGQEIFMVKSGAGSVISVVFTPDGKKLVMGSTDYRLKNMTAVFNLTTRKQEILQPGLPGLPHFPEFSPRGNILAVGGSVWPVKFWNWSNGNQLNIYKEAAKEAVIFRFSPDEKMIATSCISVIKLWDATTDKEIAALKGHTSQVNELAFSPDGKKLASASLDGTAKVWDLTVPPPDSGFKWRGVFLHEMAFSPDDSRLALATTEDPQATVLDVTTGREIAVLNGHSDAIQHLVFSPDGRMLATGSVDRTVKLWDVETARELATFKHSRIWSLAFSPDGKKLAAAGYDGSVKLWDPVTRNEIAVMKIDAMANLAFSPDGQRLAVTSAGGATIMWDVAKKQEIGRYQHARGVLSAMFSPDGKWLVIGYRDHTARLYDAMTGVELTVFRGHGGEVWASFSPDGKRLLTYSMDRTVKLWDVKTGQELITFSTRRLAGGVATFSHNGRTLALGMGDKHIKLLRIPTEQEVRAKTH